MQPPTSRVVRGRQTWPSASRVRPGSVWSGWARWDRQRTIFMDPSPAAQPGLSRASSSKSSRARQPRKPPLHQRTDRRTLYRTRKFSEVRSGTLGPKRARDGPIIPQYDSVGKGLIKILIRGTDLMRYGAKTRGSLQKPALCSDCLRSLTGRQARSRVVGPSRPEVNRSKDPASAGIKGRGG